MIGTCERSGGRLNSPTCEDMATAACEYVGGGLSVLPAYRDRKCPALGTWKRYQTRLPTKTEIRAWFAKAHDALCLVTGAVSGNLELVDFDFAGELFDAWCQRVDAVMPGLVSRLYLERTQSSGWHAVYRSAVEVCGSIVLARRRRVVTPDEITLDEQGREVVALHGKPYIVHMDKDGTKYVLITLIETRGEAGLFLCAPTAGYEPMQGSLCDLPVLTAEERDTLLMAAWELNEYVPPVVDGPRPAALPGSTPAGTRPGDDFNARGDIRPYLVKAGWTHTRTIGDNEHWRRPGKTRGSASATFNGKCFYVFSTNAYPFEGGQGYSPFAAYARIEHGGDWAEAARRLGESGYGPVRLPDTPADVAISGIADTAPANAEEADERSKEVVENPGETPEHLLRVPGFIDLMIDRCLDGSPAPLLQTAFCGALALQAHLAGQRVREPGDLRTNLYILALTGSSAGKNYIRRLNKRVLFVTNQMKGLGDRFASAEGLEDKLHLAGVKFYQNDEMDALLRGIKMSTDGRADRIVDFLNEMYTSAGDVYKKRDKAGRDEPEVIDQPHLTIFGTALPTSLYEAMTPRMLTGGFFARLIIVDADREKVLQDAIPPDQIPKDILDIASAWAAFNPGERGNLGEIHPTPITVPVTAEAKAVLDEYRAAVLGQENEAKRRSDEVARATWGRANENARKLALVHACSATFPNLKIDRPAAEWAVAFVDHQVRRMLWMAWRYVPTSPFHAQCLKLKNILREEKDRRMRAGRLLGRTHLKKREFADVVEVLVESGAVRYTKVATKGRPAEWYELLEP